MKGYILRTWALWVRGLILALLSVSLVTLFTQSAYAATFARSYGGTDLDEVLSVQRASDGGYIAAGYTWSFGAGRYDIFLIKTDANGNLQWAKTYGGTNDDYAYSVQQTSDGGYIVVGYTNSFGSGWEDILIIKTDPSGNIQWAKVYGGVNSDYAYSVQQTSDGGYIVVGYSDSYTYTYDIILIKLNSSGNVQWARTYGGGSWDYAYSVQQTSDGGYIVTGFTGSFSSGDADIILIKTNSLGNLQWAKTYRGTNYDYAYSVRQTSDGGYIVAGHTLSFGAGNWDVFLIKTDANGNLQWAKTYGGTDWDESYSVQQTSDGGYILAVWTNSFSPGGNFAIIKTNASGNVQWAKNYAGAWAGWTDRAKSVQQTPDGGYIAAGRMNENTFLVKMDANGNVCSAFQDISLTVTTPSPTVTSPSLTVYSVSPTVLSVSPIVTSPTLIVSDPCFLNISESCQIVSGLITPYKGGIKVRGSGEFEVKVYNVSGGVVKSVKGKNEVKLELSRGVYFVEVILGGKVIREKVVIR
jgi:uncharacterized delta-60 repeat protein